MEDNTEYTPNDIRKNASILFVNDKFLHTAMFCEYNPATTTGDVKPRLKDIRRNVPKIGEILDVDMYTISEVIKGELQGEAIKADTAPDITEFKGSGNSFNLDTK